MKENCNGETIEFTPEGYAAINAHIEKLENIVNKGIVNPEKALECCRNIKAELYRVLQTLRDSCVVSPEVSEPNKITF
jgi:hypothetical protein